MCIKVEKWQTSSTIFRALRNKAKNNKSNRKIHNQLRQFAGLGRQNYLGMHRTGLN